MTLQWTIVVTFLYTEIAVCLLLLLPCISARRYEAKKVYKAAYSRKMSWQNQNFYAGLQSIIFWDLVGNQVTLCCRVKKYAARWRSIFKSRWINTLASYANYYFMMFLLLLVILFLDAIRDVRNYSQALHVDENKRMLNAKTSLQMKLFRAQRNLYIASFAVLLFLVLHRLVVLINHQATLIAECEALNKKSENASTAAKRFMEDQENKTNETGHIQLTNDLEEAKAEIAKLKEKLKKSLADLEAEKHQSENNLKAMKQQSGSTSRDYDRLLKEKSELQEHTVRIEAKTAACKKVD